MTTARHENARRWFEEQKKQWTRAEHGEYARLNDVSHDPKECCGSCMWCDSVEMLCENLRYFSTAEYLNCSDACVPEMQRGEFYVSPDDRCHHTPSHWTRRTP